VSSTREEVQIRVLTVIGEIVPDVSNLSPEFSLANELDSLDRITLFMALEEEFSGKVEQKQAEHIDTVNDVVDYIYKKMTSEDISVESALQFGQPATKC